ncbi:MAG: hypothetical protein ACRDQB_01180, partial [Thermocrispum sp.]
MPEDDRYDTGGFQQDDTGIYGDSGYEGGANDFESWDWKQIKAAVVGGAAMVPGEGGHERASMVADPGTLYAASGAFNSALLALRMVAENVRLQAEALAGADGPWQGAAATSFRTMMETFSARLESKADQIAGGASGTNDIPRQLWNNGEYLRWAQNTINQIDYYYAAAAQADGVGAMDNGLIPISQRPEMVEQMTEDMRKVIRLLAADYGMTVSDVVQPDPSSLMGPDGSGGPPGVDDLPPPPTAE